MSEANFWRSRNQFVRIKNKNYKILMDYKYFQKFGIGLMGVAIVNMKKYASLVKF